MPAKRQPNRSPETTLRQWRDYRRLTLEQVANMIGKGPQAIHKWEAGKVPVTLATLRLLSGAYDASPEALLSPPPDAPMVEKLARVRDVLEALPEEQAARWLAMGEDLAGKPAKSK